uniref:Uncharacterized protein n=1 Tax=Cacopsylla melanoneura TaxID=428564 RepID=A0A8D8ZDQ0_9HEMI
MKGAHFLGAHRACNPINPFTVDRNYLLNYKKDILLYSQDLFPIQVCKAKTYPIYRSVPRPLFTYLFLIDSIIISPQIPAWDLGCYYSQGRYRSILSRTHHRKFSGSMKKFQLV